MKALLTLILLVSVTASQAQTHASPSPAEAMKAVEFLAGNWKGTQKFNPMGGAPMEATVNNETKAIIGGRFLEEALFVDLNGKKSDTRHLLTFDPAAGTYKAWWFNDTKAGATEFEGKLESDKLILISKPLPGSRSATLRVTYAKLPEDGLSYGLEMKQGEEWIQLFTTLYKRG